MIQPTLMSYTLDTPPKPMPVLLNCVHQHAIVLLNTFSSSMEHLSPSRRNKNIGIKKTMKISMSCLKKLKSPHQCFDRELFRAFPSFYFLLWCDFDAILQACKPCLKSRKLVNFALLQQPKLKSWSSKFFCKGSRPETVHFMPYNLASLWLPSCMVNCPQAQKVQKLAIKMCFY